MSEHRQEKRPGHESVETMPHDTVIIEIVDPREMGHYLDEPNVLCLLADSSNTPESLPAPLKESSLGMEILGNHEEMYYGLSAALTFELPPQDEPENETHTWNNYVLHALQCQIESSSHLGDFPIYTVTHDTNSLYVIVGKDYVARITTDSDELFCNVSVKMFERSFVHPPHEPITSPVSEREIDDNLDLMRLTATLWGMTHDTVVDLYGNGHRVAKPRLRIVAPRHEDTDEAAETQAMSAPSHETDPKKVSFEDFGGIDGTIQELRKYVTVVKHPELHEQFMLKQLSGLLFYGPPGTGKSELMHATANELGADEIIEMSVTDIVDKYVGNSGKALDAYFDPLLERKERIVVIMDEFDSLGVSVGSAGTSERVDVVNQLKRYMIIIANNHPNIILLGATNHLDRVDPALIRPGRMQTLEVPAPSLEGLRSIWERKLSKFAIRVATKADTDFDEVISGLKLDIPATEASETTPIERDPYINLAVLANLSSGKTGAHIQQAIQSVCADLLYRYVSSGRKEQGYITQTALEDALSKTSVPED